MPTHRDYSAQYPKWYRPDAREAEIRTVEAKGYRLLGPTEEITRECEFLASGDMTLAGSNIGYKAGDVQLPYYIKTAWPPQQQGNKLLLGARILKLI